MLISLQSISKFMEWKFYLSLTIILARKAIIWHREVTRSLLSAPIPFLTILAQAFNDWKLSLSKKCPRDSSKSPPISALRYETCICLRNPSDGIRNVRYHSKSRSHRSTVRYAFQQGSGKNAPMGARMDGFVKYVPFLLRLLDHGNI